MGAKESSHQFPFSCPHSFAYLNPALEPPHHPALLRSRIELAKLVPDLHPDATGWGALIDGPGGMGKTTLAIRAAELAAPGHYDEIIFLSAKQTANDPHGPHDESAFAISGFTQMLDAIARRLQKPEITQAPAEERPRLLIDALTSTRTLLVLDN